MKKKNPTAQPSQLCSNNNQTLLGAAGFADAFKFCTWKYILGSAPLVCIPTADWISTNSHNFYHHQNTQKSTFPWKRGCAEKSVQEQAGHIPERSQGQAIKRARGRSKHWNLAGSKANSETRPAVKVRSWKARSGPKAPTTEPPGNTNTRVSFLTLMTEKTEITLLTSPP